MLAYLNAKAKILEYIKEHNLQIGDRLPTEVELSDKLGIGRLSLREGLTALKSEGIIMAVQGRGTFVAYNGSHISDSLNFNYSVTDMIRSSGYQPGVSYFKKELVKANSQVAKSLGIEEGSDVPLITRVRTADNLPVVITQDYLSPSLVTAFLSMSENDLSLYGFLERNPDVKIGASTTEISPECANEERAIILNIQSGTPILVLRASVNDVFGTPLIYAQEYFRADMFKFIVTRGKPMSM